jgi:excisionase family DNA binding protein
MPDHAQFGVRKNPAPHSRQHGLCLALDTNPGNAPINETLQTREHRATNSPAAEPQLPPHAAPQHAATAGEAAKNPDRLLTIREVAEMLQVPVSWVYGRTRKRSSERMPGYRLGKYWRFDRAEILSWVARHKITREAA